MTPSTTSHIQTDPSICGGLPCVAGTRIRVQDIYVWHELQGQTADVIVSRFPQLRMGDVYAAMAYYWDHREEVDRQMRDETSLVEKLKQQSSPSPLQKKLAGHVANDPLPPG